MHAQWPHGSETLKKTATLAAPSFHPGLPSIGRFDILGAAQCKHWGNPGDSCWQSAKTQNAPAQSISLGPSSATQSSHRAAIRAIVHLRQRQVGEDNSQHGKVVKGGLQRNVMFVCCLVSVQVACSMTGLAPGLPRLHDPAGGCPIKAQPTIFVRLQRVSMKPPHYQHTSNNVIMCAR